MADEALARAARPGPAAVTDHRRVHLRYLVPARDEATERDVDPMRVVGHGRPLVPRGLVPPRRGHPDVPDGPRRGAHRPRRRRHPAAGGARARPVRGHLPARAGRPRRDAAAAARGHVGRRLLPRGVRRGGAGRATAVGSSSGCAPPTRPGCVASCGASGAAAACSSRRTSSPRCAPGRAAALTAYPGRRRARAEPCCRGGAGCSLWTVLLAGVGGAGWAYLAWRVWGTCRALAAEVERAGALVAELEARADELRDLDPPADGGHPAAAQDARGVSASSGPRAAPPASAPTCASGCRRGPA